ncbi:MAG: ABC transporter ATP-binding protein [Clostridia bacterium]|nr:ABC transporter ATP-binding protein [Clostridia bacterium]
MLDIQNITVKRGRRVVLEGLSFTAAEGLTAVIGKNGCGKSTLASAIGGTLAYSGSIRANGREIRDMKPRERARTLTLLPQILNSPHITAYELIMMGRNAYIPLGAAPTEADRAVCTECAERVGITELIARPVNELSGGERQKAYLAAVLAAKTDILVLDEPTAFADMHFAREFISLLSDIAHTEGKTVVCVMHDINLALRYADRIAVLDNGTVTAFAATERLLETDIIEKTFSLTRHTADSAVFFR